MIIGKILPYNLNTRNTIQNRNNNYTNFTSIPLIKADTFEKNPQIIKNNYSPNFCGINFDSVNELTKVISKRTYSKKRLIETYNKFPEAQGITMCREFPAAWMERISDITKFDKEAFCERLGEIFTIDRHFSDIDVLTDNLRNLFKDHGIIEDKNILTVDYLDCGMFGRAFKLNIENSDSKVIKEFKRTYRFHNNHGNYSEQNLAEHIKNFAGDETNMVKYYYGDTKNGLMIVDYISENTPEPKIIVQLDELGLAHSDRKKANYAGKHIIDYGGLITINNLAGNKNAQKIHQIFKYMDKDADKIQKFNEIFANNQAPEYIDNLIGLTHSVKYLPEDIQLETYEKLSKINERPVNIALIEEIKNFKPDFRSSKLVENLANNQDRVVKEIISREIASMPDAVRHELFERLSLEDNVKIKKYLARNINHYSDRAKLENRINIFDNLCKGADTYANIELINSLQYFGPKNKDKYFEHFFNIDDVVVKSALTRALFEFKDEPELMKKWVNKLKEVEDVRVKRSLCEAIEFMPENLKFDVIDDLLEIKDMNAKEFLAKNLFSMPYYSSHKEWLVKLLDGADNSVRREVAKGLNNISSPYVREKWEKILLDGADESVKKLAEQSKKK